MKTDNPVAAGILMGVGSFLTSYVNMRMTIKEFNLDVEKFEEAKANNANQNEINRRRIMVDERGLELREDELDLRAKMPWLEQAAKQDAFATNLENEVLAEQTLGKIKEGFERTRDARELRDKKDFAEFNRVTIPEKQIAAGVPVTGAGRSSPAGLTGLNALHPITGIPHRLHNRAVDAANRFVADLADSDESGFGARLNRFDDGTIDYSQLPHEALDMWGRSFLMSLSAEDIDEARISEFFQRRGISTSVLTEFGIDPANPRLRMGQAQPGQQTQSQFDPQAPDVSAVQKAKYGDKVAGIIKGETRGQAALRLRRAGAEELNRLYPPTAAGKKPKADDDKGLREIEKLLQGDKPKSEALP
jgi:hypothetical protein